MRFFYWFRRKRKSIPYPKLQTVYWQGSPGFVLTEDEFLRKYVAVFNQSDAKQDLERMLFNARVLGIEESRCAFSEGITLIGHKG